MNDKLMELGIELEDIAVELNEWNINDFMQHMIEEYTEIEDEAFTRWQLFTFYLLDPDSEARLV